MTRELRAFLVGRQQSALRVQPLPCYGLQPFLCNWLDGFLRYLCVFRLLLLCLVVYSILAMSRAWGCGEDTTQSSGWKRAGDVLCNSSKPRRKPDALNPKIPSAFYDLLCGPLPPGGKSSQRFRPRTTAFQAQVLFLHRLGASGF